MPHYSLKDVFHEGTDYAERAATDFVRITREKLAANDNRARSARPRFDVTWAEEVDATQAKEFVIDGVFGVGEFSSLTGKPGTGKSVVATDAAFHIAAGADWHGRDVKSGLVVYFAAERKKLTERRVAALSTRHGTTSVPLAIVGGKLDLTRGLADAQELVRLIKGLESICGEKCVWIIVDTLSRTFGGGDQNASKDMAKFVQSVDEVIRRTGAHVTAIHHSPWNEDRGKGAIDLDGAVDASFLIKKSGKNFTLICDGSNDGEDGPVLTFRLESFEFGHDESGNPIAAPLVVPTKGGDLAGLVDENAEPTPSLGRVAMLAMKVLHDALEQAPEPAPAGPWYPQGVPLTKWESWRQRFLAAHNTKPASADRSFRRIAQKLADDGLVGGTGQFVWLADDGQTRTCPVNP